MKSMFRLSRMERLVLQLPLNARLLDIGCWNANNLRPLKTLRPDVRMFGVDKIDYRGHPPDILENYARLDLDTDSLPFEEASFDCVRMAHLFSEYERSYN